MLQSERLCPLTALERQRLDSFLVALRQKCTDGSLRALLVGRSADELGGDYKKVLSTVAKRFNFSVEYVQLEAEHGRPACADC